MLLTIDIGNTNVTLGVFDGERLVASWRLASDAARMPDEYAVMLMNLLPQAGVHRSDVTAAVLCSSVPPLVGAFEELCERYYGVRALVVGAGVKTGVKVLYENPREVGADRIADAAAAFKRFGGPCIIADCGTATVFDAVTANGEYLGGAIAPGIQLAADALTSRAAMLRRIELTGPKTAIGRNTVHALQAGIIFGYVGLVKELLARFKAELGGNPRVIATGGLAGVIARQADDLFDAVEPDLTLEGLRIIHELNRE